MQVLKEIKLKWNNRNKNFNVKISEGSIKLL
jgi:hypothetical protein